MHRKILIAGWSSPVARQAHNLKVGGSNPPPATNKIKAFRKFWKPSFYPVPHWCRKFWRQKNTDMKNKSVPQND